jgi:hypothetical protein
MEQDVDPQKEYTFSHNYSGMLDATDQALTAIQEFTNFTQLYQEHGSKSPEWQDVREVFTRGYLQS